MFLPPGLELVLLYVWLFCHMYAWGPQRLEEGIGSLELELLVAVSHYMLFLRAKLRFCEGAVSSLTQ